MKTKRRIVMTAFPIFAVITFIAALSIGASSASVGQAIGAFLSGDLENTDFKIIFYIRLPRALGALLAGAALSVSGVIIQGVLQNPMASPSVIGVNAGAGLAVIIVMALFPSFTPFISIAAFLGALAASLLIYAISAIKGAGKVSIALVGVAVGSVLTAGMNAVKTLFPDSVYDISGFLIGGLSAVDPASVTTASVMIIPALLIVFFMSSGLDLLCLGTDVAASLGVNVKVRRIVYLTMASVLAGAAVSFSGLIGFVGLLIPHIMRSFVGNSHKYLIPASIFGGGTFLLFADTVSRTVFAPYELPVGIFMSLVGGPFFITLVFLKRRNVE